MSSKPVPWSISLTVHDMEEVERIAGGLGMNRSSFIRSLVRDARGRAADPKPAPQAVNGVVASSLRDAMAGLLGAVGQPDDGYPDMSLDAYGLALVVARKHHELVRAGSMPMAREDAAAAGLDPDGRETWRLYTEVLPEFFRRLVGADRPPMVDILYEPLDYVDGQDSGAVVGVVESCTETYPDGDTTRYVEMVVRTGRQTIRVLVPTGCGGDDVTEGLTVYAAGTFTVERRQVVMSARKCVVRRVPGFGDIYDVADAWGVPDAVSGQAVAVLLGCHGQSAPDYGTSFAAYLTADRDALLSGGLQMPGGRPLKIYKNDTRGVPDGPDAFRWCFGRWPALAQRARRGP